MMLSDQNNSPEVSNSAAVQNLLCLMCDLETLQVELLAYEDATGQPIVSHHAPLADRLGRAGVSRPKIDDFVAWRQSLSNLISSSPLGGMPRIAAVEQVGLILLGELIASLRAQNKRMAARSVTGLALVA
jgi:hypothetical protein